MEEIKLRKIIKKDWDFILSLRNDEKNEKNFYTKNKIGRDEHYSYLTKQEINEKFFHWIICFGKLDAGYVRILDNDISIIIDETFQNKGIGTLALIELEKKAKENGIKKLVGKMMIHNNQSKKIFEKNHYKLLMYWFEKDIS